MVTFTLNCRLDVTVSVILSNPGVTHSVPTAFIIDECSGNGMGPAWVTKDGYLLVL